MTPDIEVTIFDKPSGDVRGQVLGFATLKGDRERVALANLLVSKPTEINLFVPRRVQFDDIAVLTDTLNAFAAAVAKNTP